MNPVKFKYFTLFNEFASDKIIEKADSLFSEENASDRTFDVKTVLSDMQRILIAEIGQETVSGTMWQNYIVEKLAGSENPFTLAAEKGVVDSDDRLWKVALEEIAEIKRLYNYDFSEYENAYPYYSFISSKTGIKTQGKRQQLADALSDYDHNQSGNNQSDHNQFDNNQSDNNHSNNTRNAQSLEQIVDYYHKNGSGLFEAGCAFDWDGDFRVIKNNDPITFDDLIGYEVQKKMVIDNVSTLMKGGPSSNMLLYGDSGTGKSSSVKAVLNMFKDDGLKMISLNKNCIQNLKQILEKLESRGCKFIIFIDDLSFEENDMDYKSFKSIMEGELRGRAENVIICVTSNRRNLVKEIWKERDSYDDIHINDGIQEKKSLADRFGLMITYSTPNKDEYLTIVKQLADKAKIDMDEQEIIDGSLKWERRHSGRSGRTAKQYIDHLVSLQRRD